MTLKDKSGWALVAFALAVGVLVVAAMSAKAGPSTGNPCGPNQHDGYNSVLIGTNKDDVLTGSEYGDAICGGSGKDVIRGLGGNDYLNGNHGSDRIFGGFGDDLIVPGKGSDYVDCGPGYDTVRTNFETGAELLYRCEVYRG